MRGILTIFLFGFVLAILLLQAKSEESQNTLEQAIADSVGGYAKSRVKRILCVPRGAACAQNFQCCSRMCISEGRSGRCAAKSRKWDWW